MKFKEYLKTLDPKNSYWLIENGDVARLNNIPATAENLYIVYECEECLEFHAVPYTELKIDKHKDYVVCCPDDEEDYGIVNWINGREVPKELREIFNKTKFEVYEKLDDEFDNEDEDF